MQTLRNRDITIERARLIDRDIILEREIEITDKLVRYGNKL